MKTVSLNASKTVGTAAIAETVNGLESWEFVIRNSDIDIISVIPVIQIASSGGVSVKTTIKGNALISSAVGNIVSTPVRVTVGVVGNSLAPLAVNTVNYLTARISAGYVVKVDMNYSLEYSDTAGGGNDIDFVIGMLINYEEVVYKAAE